MPLQVGDRAPEIRAENFQLSKHRGKNIVVFFFPKANTSGCTKEACDFTDGMPKFTKADAVVIGVSKDSVASHQKFKKKHKLKVTLGADEDGKVCEAYAVWVEKSMYGRKYMGIERSTFLIDGKGIIRAEWRKVKVPGHTDEVLAAVKGL